MIGAVDQRHLQVDHRKTGQKRPEPSTDSKPFSTPGMYSFGTLPPTTLFSNMNPLPRRQRLADDIDTRELAGAAGLLLVNVVLGHLPGDLLAISDLRSTDIGFHLVGALKDIDLDVEVELAHALEDGLSDS